MVTMAAAAQPQQSTSCGMKFGGKCACGVCNRIQSSSTVCCQSTVQMQHLPIPPRFSICPLKLRCWYSPATIWKHYRGISLARTTIIPNCVSSIWPTITYAKYTVKHFIMCKMWSGSYSITIISVYRPPKMRQIFCIREYFRIFSVWKNCIWPMHSPLIHRRHCDIW